MKSKEIISTHVLYNTYYVVMYIMQWYEIEEKTFSKVFFFKKVTRAILLSRGKQDTTT